MTSTSPKALDDAVAALGFSRGSEPFRTGSARAAAFAAAVSDDGPAQAAGLVAPPTFAHVPAMQSLVEVIGAVTRDHVVHGEQDFVFHAPIVPNRTLLTTSTLTGVRGTDAGLLLYVRSETRTADGAPICTQTATIVRPGAVPVWTAGKAPPAQPRAQTGQVQETRFAIGPDITQAYAEAARDYSPYTLDQDAAKAAGWPAPIVHGMLTLSLAASAIVKTYAAGEATRLSRICCRFSAPLFSREGETLVVHHHRDLVGHVGFTASDGGGRTVLTRGYAEIRP
jgi:acyl dehydratase